MDYEEWFELNRVACRKEWNNLSEADQMIWDIDDIASYHYDRYINDCPY